MVRAVLGQPHVTNSDTDGEWGGAGCVRDWWVMLAILAVPITLD
jgi:hypothetical protein